MGETIEDHPRLSGVQNDIWHAYRMIEKCYANQGRLFLCGNGGSAADALHIVGELMKSFVKKRPVDQKTASSLMDSCPDHAAYLTENLQGALPAYALVENAALASAFANDVKADMAYAQQLYGYAAQGDVLIALSTSGNSRNVLNAVRLANAMKVGTVGLTGESGGELKSLCDVCIAVPERETYKIQELHLPIYHALCRMLEERFFA
jgi:D-sedoheptulose 7-phosphate isomerase